MGYFAKEGYPWVFIALLITISSYTNILNPEHPRIYYILFWTVPMIATTIFFIYFFRDPKRETPRDFNPKTSILCPADGILNAIEKEGPNLAFFIEMHGQNVHVCRAHESGRVIDVVRTKGKHKPVYYFKKIKNKKSQAIRKNGRVTIYFQDDWGREFKYQLICGMMARRSKPYVHKGQYIKKGDKVGIIMFGSLVKITLPGHNYNIKLQIGDQVRAKKMILCERLTPLNKIKNADIENNYSKINNHYSISNREQFYIQMETLNEMEVIEGRAKQK